MKDLWCRDVCAMQWVNLDTQHVSVTIVDFVQVSDSVTWHVVIKLGAACVGFVETVPFTSNEAVVQSNQHRFISCQLQLHIILHQLMFSAYTWATNFERIFAVGTVVIYVYGIWLSCLNREWWLQIKHWRSLMQLMHRTAVSLSFSISVFTALDLATKIATVFWRVMWLWGKFPPPLKMPGINTGWSCFHGSCVQKGTHFVFLHSS